MSWRILFTLLLSLFSTDSFAQLWSGVLDPSRATDWTVTGVTGGIPNRTTICPSYSGSPTPLPSSSTAAQISDAILACTNNGSGGGYVVPLAAGTFLLTDAILFRGSAGATNPAQNVTLRGQGPNSTILQFSALSTNCGGLGGGGLVCLTDKPIASGTCGFNTYNTANWTANYSAGSTTITLDNITGNNPNGSPWNPNLDVGMYLILDQLDSPSADYTSYVPFITEDSTYTNPSQAGCNSANRANRCLGEFHQVTAISGVGPFTVTITPPLAYTFWNGDGTNTPQAWWCNSVAQQVLNDGVENLTIQNTNSGGDMGYGLVSFIGAFQSWAKNVRLIRSQHAQVYALVSANIEVRDSYLYSIVNQSTVVGDQSQGCGRVSTQYGIDPFYAGLLKVENNIFQQICSSILAQPCFVCLYGYNFTIGDLPVASVDGSNNLTGYSTFASTSLGHTAGDHMMLLEGNDTNSFGFDVAVSHGAGGAFEVLLRNHATGTSAWPLFNGNPPGNTVPINHQAIHRFTSFIGNVIGSPSTQTYYESSVNVTGRVYGDPADFSLAWGYSGGVMGATGDAKAISSMIRWGNFDYVRNIVRWCGNSSDTGWGTECTVPGSPAPQSEIATGSGGSFPQSVPSKGDTAIGQPALPASFYLTAKPPWFGGSPWPVIGPDVTTGYDTSTHVGSNPARTCYLTVMKGPSDGSGPVLPFDANQCYYGQPPGGVGVPPSRGHGHHLKLSANPWLAVALPLSPFLDDVLEITTAIILTALLAWAANLAKLLIFSFGEKLRNTPLHLPRLRLNWRPAATRLLYALKLAKPRSLLLTDQRKDRE